MKRLISVILVIAMLVTFAVSCTPTSDNNDESSKTPSSSQATPGSQGPEESESETESETEKVDLGIPDDLNYNDAEVYIMHWIAYNPEFVVDEDATAGDPIYDAIYKKNLYTEEKLGIKLNFTPVEGDGGGPQPFINALKNRMSDPTTPVDIMSAYARTTAMTSLEGVLHDLRQFDNLDLSKEWWPKNIQEEYDLDGHLYFVSGDISSNLLLMMYGVFFNKSLLNSYGIENPVQLVRDNEWTVDKFIEMSSGVYEDIDGTPGKSGDDFFGLTNSYWDFDAMYHAAGYRLVVKDTSGDAWVKYADELFSDIAGSYIEKLSEWVRSDDVISETDYSGTAGRAFLEGRSLFRINASSIGFSLRETELDYGVVPMPKYDLDVQEDYVTCLANPFSLYGICTASLDTERAAATLQVLGYYALENTTPAVYEVTMKGKFSKDDDSMEMFDLMRKGISFDLGRVYHTQLGGLCDVVSMAITRGTEWSINYTGPMFTGRKTYMKKLNTLLDDLLNQ